MNITVCREVARETLTEAFTRMALVLIYNYGLALIGILNVHPTEAPLDNVFFFLFLNLNLFFITDYF